MMGLQTQYDRWATGGRYSSSPVDVTCPTCGEVTTVNAESEYGATTWTPEECPGCGEVFPDDAKWEDSEPPCD